MNTLQPQVAWILAVWLTAILSVTAALLVFALFWVVRWLKSRQVSTAAVEVAQGRRAEAMRRYARARRWAQWGLYPQTYRTCSLQLSGLLRSSGKPEEALRVCREALGRQRLGRQSLRMQAILHNEMALTTAEQGKQTDAVALFRSALDLWQRRGLADPSWAVTCENLAFVLGKQGEQAGRLAALRGALRQWEALPDPDPQRVIRACIALADALPATGDEGEAVTLWRRVLELVAKMRGPNSGDSMTPLMRLLEIHRRQGQYAEYESTFEQWLACCQAQPNYQPLDLASARLVHAQLRLERGECSEAEAEMRVLMRELPAMDAERKAWALHLCARARMAVLDYSGARMDAAAGLELLRAGSARLRREIELLELIGDAARGQSDVDAAHHHYQAALALLNASFGDEDPWLQSVRCKLSELRPDQSPTWVQ